MPRKPKPWPRHAERKWYVTYRGKQHPLATFDEGEEAAWAAFYRLMAAEGEVRAMPARPRTFAEVAELYLHHVRETCRPATFAAERARIELACDRFGRLRTDRIRAVDAERWVNSRPLAPTSRRGYLVTLRRCLAWARRAGLIAHEDLMVGLRLPRGEKRQRILSPEEAARLVEAATEPFRAFLKALLVTGARPGVLCRLEARHVAWAASEAAVESKGRPYRLVVTEALAAILRPLALARPEGPLFLDARGRPWNRNSIRLRMARLRRKLGLGDGVVAYAARHTYATNALADGESPAIVAELLNHADLSMLAGHYSHLAQRRDAVRRAAERASGGTPDPAPPPAPPGTRRRRTRGTG